VLHKKTLVIGVGNPLLTDDGIGPWLIDCLEPLFSESCTFKKEIDVDFADLDDMRGYDAVIIIDAIEQSKPLGVVTLIEPPIAERIPDMISGHGQHLFDILDLGKRIYKDFPGRIYVIGVQVKDPYTWHEGFSLELSNVLEELARKVSEMLSHLIGVRS